MSDLDHVSPLPTAGSVVTAVLGLVTGGLALAFNPFFAMSVIAAILGVLTLRSARNVRHPVTQGMLRIFAVIAIMGAAGGVMVLLFPGLGVGARIPGM
jgi:hypothetical protein